MADSAFAGQVIGGRYRLVGRLGSGGFGRVWRAEDISLGVEVAVKEVWLPPAISAGEHAERLRRAEREARNALRLRDRPGIVTVYDVVIESDVPWIVMQLVEGRSLEDHVRANGPVSESQAIEIARALLRALGAAHDMGVVHRDVKPANVLLSVDGEVLLTGFGIAVHATDTAPATGVLIGSPEYMAPERLGDGQAGVAADLFSLGATLYQAVEGESPFHRDLPAASLAAVLTYEVPPSARVGAPLADLIAKLLLKVPARRITVPEALTLLERPQNAARRVTEETAPRPEVEADEERRRDWVRAFVVVLAIGAAGMLGLAQVLGGDRSVFVDGEAIALAAVIGAMVGGVPSAWLMKAWPLRIGAFLLGSVLVPLAMALVATWLFSAGLPNLWAGLVALGLVAAGVIYVVTEVEEARKLERKRP